MAGFRASASAIVPTMPQNCLLYKLGKYGYFVELQNREGYFDAITMRLEIVF